jgi:flagellar biosynthetic protein FliR
MLVLFLCILARASGALTFNPIFGRSEYPPQARAALILVTSVLGYNYCFLAGITVNETTDILMLMIMLLRELFAGFVLGFGMQLAFLAVHFGTALIDYMMGLSMAQMYDPSSGNQMSVSQGLYQAFMVMIFFAGDCHIAFFRILLETLDRIPLGNPSFPTNLVNVVISYFSECLVLGLQFAIPVIVVEMMVEVGLGILMRLAPQINIFMVNFQIKLIAGIALLVLLFNPMASQIGEVWSSMFDVLYDLIALMGQGG